ncbi:MAG: hypothetical protein LH470_02305 [Lysobacter sp.]|nr:hypothetical protein [Lysobacter sp.]
MKTLPLATLAATLMLAATPYSQPVNAGTALQRCQGADGTVMYTDKACGALGATATPISGGLMSRIAREEAMSGNTDTLGAFDPNDMATASVGRRSPSGGCARTPTQLAMDLRGAFALGDINRIAESYHWTGLSHQAGQRIMERLDQLTGKQITDVDYFNAQIQTAGLGGYDVASTGNTYGGSEGVMQVRFGTGASTTVTDFNVEKYSNCYFVKF